MEIAVFGAGRMRTDGDRHVREFKRRHMDEQMSEKRRRLSVLRGIARKGNPWAQLELARIYIEPWLESSSPICRKGVFWLVCAYLHGDAEPEASRRARQLLRLMVRAGHSGKYINWEIKWVRRWYKKYLRVFPVA